MGLPIANCQLPIDYFVLRFCKLAIGNWQLAIGNCLISSPVLQIGNRQLAIGNDLLDYFSEFKHARSSGDPVRGQECAAYKGLPRTCCVRQQDLIGF